MAASTPLSPLITLMPAFAIFAAERWRAPRRRHYASLFRSAMHACRFFEALCLRWLFAS
jgi:hypothetical protein